jgi:hypothetical protein
MVPEGIDYDPSSQTGDWATGGEVAPPPPPEPPPPISEPEPEPMVVVEEENALRDSSGERQTVMAGRSAGKQRRPRKAPEGAAAPAQKPEEPMAVAPAPDPNAALAGPVATASAVTIHIPAVGEAVLYQHMLLPEGKTLTVHLEARRHKPSKRKSK